MDTVALGERIKIERQRLKLTQGEFATLGGVSRQSQANYETESREPGAAYFVRLYDHVDIPFILSGQRHRAHALEAREVASILSLIDDWEAQQKQALPAATRAKAITLFLNQTMSTGEVQTDWIRRTLALMA